MLRLAIDRESTPDAVVIRHGELRLGLVQEILMQHRFFVSLSVLCGAVAVAGFVGVVRGQPARKAAEEPEAKVAAETRYSLDEAKLRAKLMHQIYVATLDTMHHRYFHSNRSVIPARAMEDVFSAVAQDTKSTARWISVNTKAMSIDHEPETDFEKQAATEISAGKPEYAAVDKGFYRSARPIPLPGGCLSCHMGLGAQSKIPRFAGLVISLPVETKE